MTELNDKPNEQPYDRVQVFSGGGSRFGYYLGSYACLHDKGIAPDVILATCGGSFASLLVDIAPDPKDLHALIQRREVYDAVSAFQARALKGSLLRKALSGQGLSKYAYHAIKRWRASSKSSKSLKNKHNLISSYQALLIELQQLAMFEIANERYWLDDLLALKPKYQSSQLIKSSSAPDIAIIASRLYPSSDINNNTSAKLQEVLFAPKKLVCNKSINLSTLECPTYHYTPERLKPTIKVVGGRGDNSNNGNQNSGWQIAQAVRASMADMYYLTPIHVDNVGWCLGGVIDLTPIELACQLGHTVFAETKQPYDSYLAVPAIKRIFGFDANERLQSVNEYQQVNKSLTNQIHWLPFADNGSVLAGQHVAKKINLKQFNLDLVHAPFDIFKQQMQTQWDYGYQRTLDYLNSDC
ncbi:patatin-like phospholipase family protein [Psychrobacter sp. FDAARGOS_221]|uniref:patatin-like phospholipase family protein n=1 Tax=Psychrobacter sp. FDAARGOS_221 TaxID=1975705 RepID=UPI000C9F8DEE|nr:patatin-like phospholipase family protein [Psychrobacter sp. FDAARGOS_221]PNK59617.1 hypothetical protein A6J60_001110 [Psychrobacter sp. FDAARGOS_221]